MAWEAWVAVVAGVLALGALVLGTVVWRRQRDLRGRLDPLPRRPTPDERPVVAVVVNPTKPGAHGLRETLAESCARRGLDEPLWFETTAEDPGVGQARDALDRGADIVLAAGGDGTVRAVAEALTGTGVPMGLLPLGTGNLLARNLDLPLNDPAAALAVALDGWDRPIDVGRLQVVRWATEQRGADPDAADATTPPASDEPGRSAPRRPPSEHLFLVIAGLGFDAAMVADADEQLKAKVGWMAYFVAGIRHLHGRRLRVQVGLDDRPATSTRLRSLLVGNCGRLPGGINLLPDAELDDGWLDVAAIDTRGGLAGWAQLLGEVVLQGIGLRNDLPAKIGRIDHTRARTVRLAVVGGEHVQVDGEVLGRAEELTASVDARALRVRVAHP